MNSIHEKYYKDAVPQIKKQFGLKNDLEVPRITKVVINAGIGKFLKDGNAITEVEKSLAAISGQKAVLTKSRQSIAGFKIRQGLEIGVKVTLRGRRMWDFIERFVGATLPRIRDFRGLPHSNIDENGNLNIGLREQLIFPEIIPEQVKNTFSLQVNVVTDAKNKEKGTALFKLLGFPIESKQ